MDSAEKSEGASVTDDTAMASRGKRIMLQKAVTFDSSALDHKSSNGNSGDRRPRIGTMRTQLQNRKASLDEEIGREEKLFIGSKRLLFASHDLKTKNQAELEVSFSDSKIKALQAELSRINSSLQTYQPQRTLDTQIPLIPLTMKSTMKISFVTQFSEILKDHYYADPFDLQDAMYEFQELRYSIATVSRDDAGIDNLIEYYNHLRAVAMRFFSSKAKHSINFVWYDAINGLPAAQQSVAYEKASIIFNIAALYTQLASQQDRSTCEGIDKAIQYLAKSVGCFLLMKQKFIQSPTTDMSKDMLSLFENLMKAQAQELVWEKMILNKISSEQLDSLITQAQMAQSVAKCYEPVRSLLNDKVIKDYLPESWTAMIKLKSAHFKSLSHYCAATICGKLAAFKSEEESHLTEALRTELHFLYEEECKELFSSDIKDQLGLMKSHLHCAELHHDTALKALEFCRELKPIKPLGKMLHEGHENTKQKSSEIEDLETNNIISPTIQASVVEFNPVSLEFTSVQIPDLFKALGPLPAFSASNCWTEPRIVNMKRRSDGYGFTVQGSKPVKVLNLVADSPAQDSGLLEGDWILTVNGVSVRYKSHSHVVKLVKDSEDELSLRVTTPRSESSD